MSIDFNMFAIAGIPLLTLIFGITSWFKSVGVTGNWLKVIPMILAIVLGSLYQLRLAYPLWGAPYLDTVVVAIAFALAAAGIYDQIKEWSTGTR